MNSCGWVPGMEQELQLVEAVCSCRPWIPNAVSKSIGAAELGAASTLNGRPETLSNASALRSSGKTRSHSFDDAARRLSAAGASITIVTSLYFPPGRPGSQRRACRFGVCSRREVRA